jgi:hypothetical protein
MSSAKLPENVICKIGRARKGHLQNSRQTSSAKSSFVSAKFQATTLSANSGSWLFGVFKYISAKSRVATGDYKRIRFNFTGKAPSRFVLATPFFTVFSYLIHNPECLKESYRPSCYVRNHKPFYPLPIKDQKIRYAYLFPTHSFAPILILTFVADGMLWYQSQHCC